MADPLQPLDLQSPADDDVFFKNYVPPARDAIHLPIHVLYMLIATVVILMTLYAIIGHLIKDLIHDFAGKLQIQDATERMELDLAGFAFSSDWLFGGQPDEVKINFLEQRDKFMVDWSPETSPELEELAREEEIKVVMEGSNRMPTIWVISGTETRVPRTGPRVSFDRNIWAVGYFDALYKYE